MDFFASQDVHRRNTVILLVYFVFAVTITATAAYFVALAYWFVLNRVANFWRDLYGFQTVSFQWWDISKYYLIAGPFAAALISLSIWRTRKLAAPVDYIMSLIGAAEVDRSVRHPPTKQFIDVVEEMSIASGTPMPRTFVITREYGINAMAAGWSSGSAAIASSAGAIQMLTRDEMQGVVAHEFSHILNGDMAMNVRLLGVLYGIDCIGIIGRMFVGFLVKSSQMGIPGHSNVVAMGSWVALLLSLPFAALSWLGVLLGQLIRASISRQREYLADASAVQFTRYPEGIAGALTKIGGLTAGSSMQGTSLVASHFFLASAFGSSSRFLSPASHPPLADRVRRINPGFSGEFPYVPMHYEAKMGDPRKAAWQPGSRQAASTPGPVVTTSEGAAFSRDDISDSLTAPNPQYEGFAEKLMGGLPQVLAKAACVPEEAMLVIYALLLAGDEQKRLAQVSAISGFEGRDRAERVVCLAEAYTGADQAAEVPLMDRAFRALKKLSHPELRDAYETFSRLFPVGEITDENAFVFTAAIDARLASMSRRNRQKGLAVKNLPGIEAELMTVAAYLLKWKQRRAEENTGKDSPGIVMPMLAGIDLEGIDTSPQALKDALDAIASTEPALKKEMLVMMVKLLAPEGRIDPPEAEMIWLLSELARSQIPPVMPGLLARRIKR